MLKGAPPAFVIMLLLSGQAFGLQTFTGPSGETLNVSKCSLSPNKCLSEAATACKGPYQVVDSESHAGGLLADLFPGPVTWYSMTYRCGRSDGVLPTFEFRGQQYRPPAIIHQRPRNCTSTVIGNQVITNCY